MVRKLLVSTLGSGSELAKHTGSGSPVPRRSPKLAKCAPKLIEMMNDIPYRERAKTLIEDKFEIPRVMAVFSNSQAIKSCHAGYAYR